MAKAFSHTETHREQVKCRIFGRTPALLGVVTPDMLANSLQEMNTWDCG